MTETRKEKDSLGEIDVKKDAYFGAFTTRSHHNFQISGITAPKLFQQGLGIVKLAAAKTNTKLGLIPNDKSKALIQACEEFIEGRFDDQFTLDVFQAGAGTSYNMNSNEVIANRGNEILGAEKGTYTHIHPNNTVNMAQSTNDVIPTATKVSIFLALPGLVKEVEKLIKELEKLSEEHKDTIKVGRTHMQDAVPITLGQEFDAYAKALSKSLKLVISQSDELLELGIGGTAVGTGINTDPQYKPIMVRNLSEITGVPFKSGENLTEMANNFAPFMNFSGSLRSLATNLLNIVGDLKLMNMGPKAGIAELTLPEVQAGSSIMPGKVNPSIPECIEMISLQVLGNDKTIELCAHRGQFDLNVLCPLIMYNILQSMEILTNGAKTLREFALEPIIVNKDQIKHLYENSLVTATALAPYIGYNETASVVKTALKEGRTIREEILKRGVLTEEELNKILSQEKTTKPSRIDESLVKD